MKHFTTGEFAEICGVKKQTIFHYDEIGLLKPDYKRANGYRYYSIQQVETFYVIEMLKEIDMSLAEIKHFLEIKSPEKTIALLAEKELMMAEKIKKMGQIQQIIHNKKTQIENTLNLNFDNITIQHCTAYSYILSQKVTQYSDKSVSKLLMNFINETKEKALDRGYPIGVLLPCESILKDDYQRFTYFCLRIDDALIQEPLMTEPSYIRPAGDYVIAYHKGSYLYIHETYAKIKTYLATTRYELIGNSIEEYLLDEVSVNGLDNYVTRIMIGVSKR